MAYSRWNKHCVWYTFWSALCSPSTTFRFPTKKLKAEQCLEICDFPSYSVTYGELKERGIKKTMQDIQKFYTEENKKATFSDYTELRWILVRFMDDVDEHFSFPNFFIFDWWYPTRNQVYSILRQLRRKK